MLKIKQHEMFWPRFSYIVNAIVNTFELHCKYIVNSISHILIGINYVHEDWVTYKKSEAAKEVTPYLSVFSPNAGKCGP